MTLLLTAHPDPNSFTAAITTALEDELRSAGLAPRTVDLYRCDETGPFPGLLEAPELRRKTSLDPQVQKQMRLVEEAEFYAVVHPDWWGGPPAILKGWIDRVLRPGTAYETSEGFGLREPQGLLAGRRAVVIVCGDADSPGPLRDFWINRIWAFCGVDAHFAYFPRTRQSSARERDAFLRDASAAALSFLTAPVPNEHRFGTLF